jgi:Type ISP C-terminal specificity domain/N-6 DNA Methylase
VGAAVVHARSFGTLADVVDQAVSEFGAMVTAKLRGPGYREDQLRGPLEELLKAVAGAMHLTLVPHGETPLADRTAIPDYAIDIDGLPIGHVELKAPGKGVDPAGWSRGSHDRRQWEKLSLLPNILYTDGDSWALVRSGQRIGRVARVRGSVETSGGRLQPADGELLRVLSDFLQWIPRPPGDLERLVKNVAGLCSLLRDEVRETLRRERAGERETDFASLVEDWRRALFPSLNDEDFADAYAQTVTFALLLARVENIHFEGRTVEEIARLLGKSHSLMGKALDVLTPGWVLGRLASTIETLRRVIGTVDWDLLDDGTGNAYRDLYERFLAVYDSELRKRTGAYYTPTAVVSFMVRFVDDVLRARLGFGDGFAAPGVFTVDPAMGTGTFLVEIIDKVARTASADGEVVRAKLRELAERLVGFEKQACPYAVAELRVAEAMRHHETDAPADGMCLYVADAFDAIDTDNLLDEFGDPLKRRLGTAYEPIERSRREANRVKATEHVEVVLGNPPYLERAKGLGGWIERGNRGASGSGPVPLDSFRIEGEGRYNYKLANLYVYFWRWATWKVFDAHPDAPTGVVAFISASSYTTGTGFAGMRQYLRRTADEGWIIDLSPEGHRPAVPTRLFPKVSQPLCIGIFVRYNRPDPDTPARVHYLAIEGSQAEKFERLEALRLDHPTWKVCSTGWRTRLKPPASQEWSSFPALADLLPWSEPGIKPNRTWVYAPDPSTLRRRWERLVRAPVEEKGPLLKETRDCTIDKRLPPVDEPDRPRLALRDERGPCPDPVRIAFRSFDRQWLIPDARVIDFPRRELWRVNGERQLYLTEPHTEPVTGGPALTFAADPPDTHHYHGRGGRVVPLYRDKAGTRPNTTQPLLVMLSRRLGARVTGEDLVAYVAGIAAHSSFSKHFAETLDGTGVRIPLTTDGHLFDEAISVGCRVIWLQTYGQRFVDPSRGRPLGPPRLSDDRRPCAAVEIPIEPECFPQRIAYDPATQTLLVGEGQIRPVPPAVWGYEVSGMRVIRKWFRSRTGKPTGRHPTMLDFIRPTYWTAAMNDELRDLLHVLGLLVDLEPIQRDLLQRVCAGPLLTVDDLLTASVLPASTSAQRARPGDDRQAALF